MAMGNEETLKILIEAQNKAQKAFDEAQKQIKDTEKVHKTMTDSIEANGEKMKSVGKKMTGYMTLPILAASALSIKAFSNLEETINKVDVSFGSSSGAVKKWSNGSIKSMGLAQQSALDSAALFGDMGTGMGQTEAEAAKMSTGLTQLGADMASFKNVSFDRAQTALAGVYTGETEALKSLGVVMTETNLQEYAASKGIKKKLQDMTQAEKVQLRYNFVMDKTKNAQGDFARTSDSLANKQRTAVERTKELSAQFGKQLAPAYNAVLDVGTKLLAWFGKLSSGQKKAIVIVLGVIAVIGPLVTVVGALATAVTFLVSPIGLVIIAIVAIGAALTYAYFKFEGFRKVVDSVWRAIVTVVLWAWNNVIKPVWTALVWYITNVVVPVWKKIWDVAKIVWDAIVKVVQWAWNTIIKPIWDVIWSYITNVLVPVWKKIFEIAKQVWDGVWKAVTTAWAWIKPIFEAVWAYIRDTLVPAFQKIWDKVRDVFTSVWDKISTVKNNVVNAFNTVKSAIQSVVDKFGTVKQKVSSAFNGVKEVITKPFETAMSVVKKAWNSTLGGKGFSIPDIPGIPGRGKKFEFPKLYKGARDFMGGAAIVGDIRGRGGEIINMPRGTDVFTNRESKRILRGLADGQGGGGSVTNMFTGNIYIADERAAKKFFEELNRQAELSSYGVPA